MSRRDVALATIFGRNAVVTTAFLPAIRVMLRKCAPSTSHLHQCHNQSVLSQQF